MSFSEGKSGEERPPLRYDLCVRCRKEHPRPTFCLCFNCNSIWSRNYRTSCASCGIIFEDPNHKEICQKCYDEWSTSIPESIYMIPPNETREDQLGFKSGMCARCRREPVWSEIRCVKRADTEKVEKVEQKSYLCSPCFNEWRSLPGPILCASCGKCRCVPHGEVCKDCKEEIDEINNRGPYKPGTDTLGLNPCPFGDKCNDMTERHVSAFSHPSTSAKGTCDLKSRDLCDKSDFDHIRSLLHPIPDLSLIPIQYANLRDIENPDYVMMNPDKSKYFVTDFYRNTIELKNKAKEYIKRENGGSDIDAGVFNEIRSWFMCHCPVHQCRKEVLLSCIKSSKLFSKERLHDLIVSTDEITSSIIMDPSVRSMFNFRSGELSYASIERYISLKVKETQGQVIHGVRPVGDMRDRLRELMDIIPKRNLTPEERGEIKIRQIELERVKTIGAEVVKDIDDRIKEFIEDIVNLYFSPTGIGNTANIGTRTNFTVFTIVGPHFGGYSDDCQIVLHETVMFHPDFYILPVSSLSYQDGDYRRTSTCGREAYLGPGKRWGSPSNPINDAMVDLCNEKLSPAIPEWADAMAYDWIARVHAMRGTPISSIKLSDVKQLWRDVGPFYVSEGHLPQIVPRHYWKKLFLSEETYNYIKADEQGKAFLDLMGGRAVKVVTGKDPKEEVCKYLESTHPSAYRPSGFTFSLDPHGVGEEIPIPFTLPTNTNTFIYFSSTKGIFDVILSNVADYFNKDVPRHVVTIHFDNQSRGLSVDYSVGPDSTSSGQKPAESIGEKGYGKLFDSGVDVMRDGCIRYRICIDCSKTPKTLLITHTGRSRIRSPSEFKVDLPSSCPNLTSISFSNQAPPSSNFQTTIWDVLCTTKELPEPELVKK